MITLALDTSTDVCVGVARDGVALASGVVTDRRAHAEQLMPLVSRTLAEAGVALAEVDVIAVGVGPGPFTGLRVGVVTAATLGLVLKRPVTGYCSLDAVARQWADAGAPEQFVVASDARRKEVYWATYAADGTRVDGPHVSAPSLVPDLPLGGTGAPLISGTFDGPATLDAGVFAARASVLPDAGLDPLYLRRPDADAPGTPKSTLTSERHR